MSTRNRMIALAAGAAALSALAGCASSGSPKGPRSSAPTTTSSATPVTLAPSSGSGSSSSPCAVISAATIKTATGFDVDAGQILPSGCHWSSTANPRFAVTYSVQSHASDAAVRKGLASGRTPPGSTKFDLNGATGIGDPFDARGDDSSVDAFVIGATKSFMVLINGPANTPPTSATDIASALWTNVDKLPAAPN